MYRYLFCLLLLFLPQVSFADVRLAVLEFEGTLEFHLGIIPGSTYRSYQTANPQTIVIEVDK